MNEELIQPFTKEEIEEVIRKMPAGKAPGSDGFSGHIHKRYWNIVSDDVIKAVLDFQSTSRLPSQWKSTFVTLIPKVENPYRPISLCNFIYEVVAKTLGEIYGTVFGVYCC